MFVNTITEAIKLTYDIQHQAFFVSPLLNETHTDEMKKFILQNVSWAFLLE